MNRTKRSLLLCILSILLFATVIMTSAVYAADSASVWQGGVSESLSGAGTETDPYLIASGDDLAYLSKLVAEGDSFSGKYVKLVSDIDMSGAVFYPIGYDAEASYVEYDRAFSGIFDGCGHTISGISQSTAQMDGTYNGKYNAAMGLFGHLDNATVKNLIIDSFEADGEYADAGVVAAYASGDCSFVNIIITNSTVNTLGAGAGAIVGWDKGGYIADEASSLSFEGIFVDSTNVIGDKYDCFAGGMLGYLGRYSSADFVNCHVAATVNATSADYYSAGMLIGVVDSYKWADGERVVDTDRVTADASSVFGGNALISGYAWGITPADSFSGVEAKEGTVYTASKFTAIEGVYLIGTTVSVSDVFTEIDGADIARAGIKVSAQTLSGSAVATVTENASDYMQSTITFGGEGTVELTVTDGYFCIPTSVVITVYEPDPVVKFNGTDKTVLIGTALNAGDIFTAVDGAEIDLANVTVTVTTVEGENSATIGAADAWADRAITFGGVGVYAFTITDNDYCIATTATVTVYEPDPVVKFEGTNKTVLIGTTLTAGDIFSALADADIDAANVTITVTTTDGANSATVGTADAWADRAITFGGVGVYEFTITDNDYCIATTATVTVYEPDPVVKFEGTDKTVLIGTTLTAGDIFSALADVDIDAANVTITVTTTDGANSATVGTADAWADRALTFGGVGVYEFTITDNDYCIATTATVTVYEPDPVVKFEGTNKTVLIGTTLTAGDIFSALADADIDAANVTITVTTTDGANSATVGTADAWADRALTFGGVGVYAFTITDNDYCIATTATVTVYEPQPIKRFDLVFENTDKFTYRVGNEGAVTLGTLFKAVNGVEIGQVSATVTNASGNASGVFTANTDWTKATIDFDGTGIVTVTITDDGYTIATTLELEVVNAKNTTGAASATANNVVLLKDAGFGSIEVKNGYTIYGNGFTLTCSTDVVALDMGYAFVTMDNGTLDNVRIVCPNFSHAILYNSNRTENGNPSETDTNGKTRYYNIRSGILATGYNKIYNSYISGGRAAIYVTGGTTVVDNSTVYGGAVANIQVNSAANGLILRDATLIQEPIRANVNTTSNTVMGLSVLMMCDENGAAAPVTIEGELIQYAWVDSNDTQYVPEAGQTVISSILSQTDYVHSLNGTDSLNLGFAYMPDDVGSPINDPNITDNRTNKADIPYGTASVVKYGQTVAKVYSYKKTDGTIHSDYATKPSFTPECFEPIGPAVSFTDENENRVFTLEFDAVSGKWINKLTVNLDGGAYSFSFADLKLSLYGVDYAYTVKDASGNAVDNSTAIALAVGNFNYTLTATVDGEVFEYELLIVATKTSINKPEIVSTTWGAGICVATSKGGTWHGAVPALDGITVKYWSTADSAYKTINLADYTPGVSGKLNGTDKTYTLEGPDFTLVMTGSQVHSSNNVYAMPVVCDGTLYFLPASSNGLVNTGNSARSITVSYSFKDKATDEALDFSHTWSVAEDKENEYKYSDFCSGTKTLLTSSGGGSCVTADTLITLADGTQKRADELTGDELLLVWNLETGSYDIAPIVFVDNEPLAEYEVIHLYFSDGSDVKVIYEHGFFDIDLAKYVYITADNYAEYIGHTFVTMGDIEQGTWTEAVLDSVVIENELTTAWSPVTAKHLCYYTNGVLSMPGGIAGLFNIFDVDTVAMCYDAEKMAADIEAYGLFTIEDYEGAITEDAFYVFNGDYLKVAIAKGMLSWEDIAYLAERYIPLM